jgi:hypothetical protein
MRILGSNILCPLCFNTQIVMFCGFVIFFIVWTSSGPRSNPSHWHCSGHTIARLIGEKNALSNQQPSSIWVQGSIGLTAHCVDVHNGSKATSALKFGRAPLWWLYYYQSTIAFVIILWMILLSTYMHLCCFGKGLLFAAWGICNPWYDSFVGCEWNPRWGTFDWKEFCESQAYSIGWMILNMAMMLKQHEHLGYVIGSMILISIIQWLFVWGVTMMDITTDGFGFM